MQIGQTGDVGRSGSSALVSVTVEDPAVWDRVVQALPNAHILQSSVWGAFKQRQTGWTPQHVLFSRSSNPVREPEAAALILTRTIGPFAVMYAPKGPILEYSDASLFVSVLGELERRARRRGAIWFKLDADIPTGRGEPGSSEDTPNPIGQAAARLLHSRRWRFSDSQPQFRNTIQLDLTRSDEDILAAMGSGKRRKVRYGPKHGVTTRVGTLDDLPLLYRLYAETGARDEFITRPYDYYVDEWGSMMKAGFAHVLIAQVNGQAVGHVILFRYGRTCWYFTGASVSDNELRKLMPSDLLQWEAIRWAKSVGCTLYDFYGAPNQFDESDPMWGVYQFKQDFGGQVVRHIGAWDFAPNPVLYAAYERVMPRVIGLMKRLTKRGAN